MEENKMTVKRMEERLYNDYMALCNMKNRYLSLMDELMELDDENFPVKLMDLDEITDYINDVMDKVNKAYKHTLKGM